MNRTRVYPASVAALLFVLAVLALRPWRPKTRDVALSRSLECPDIVHALVFSPDGARLAIGHGAMSGSSQGRVWDLAAWRQQLVLTGHQYGVCALAFSPDSSKLGTGSFDQRLQLWKLATGRPLPVPQEPRRGALNYRVALSPDLTAVAIAAGSFEHPTLKVRGFTETGRCLEIPSPGLISDLTFSADGHWLATASQQAGLRVYDARTGAVRLTLDGAKVPYIHGVALAPDGRTLATLTFGNVNQELTLWDLNGGLRWRCTGQTTLVSCLSFSLDGRYLAGGRRDGQVLIWQVADGRVILQHHQHHEGVRAVAFSPDGRWLASGGADQMVWLWPLSPRQRTEPGPDADQTPSSSLRRQKKRSVSLRLSVRECPKYVLR
jgi:WD40 repeat protein